MSFLFKSKKERPSPAGPTGPASPGATAPGARAAGSPARAAEAIDPLPASGSRQRIPSGEDPGSRGPFGSSSTPPPSRPWPPATGNFGSAFSSTGSLPHNQTNAKAAAYESGPSPPQAMSYQTGSSPHHAMSYQTGSSPHQAASHQTGSSPHQAAPHPGSSPFPPHTNPAARSAIPQRVINTQPWTRVEFARHSSPFPRYGHAGNATAGRDGELYVFGGLVGEDATNDVWHVDAVQAVATPVATTGATPSPRVGHAAILVGNAFICFGGDTKTSEADENDNALYLLNVHTFMWQRARLAQGPAPSGRYGHSINLLGSHVAIFGGQCEETFFNDLVLLDLTRLSKRTCRWEWVDASTAVKPSPRTNHSAVNTEAGDRLIIFGGTDGQLWFDDVWVFDMATGAWTRLSCIGATPPAREGHAACLVGDVMYIFGGRNAEGEDLGGLYALKLTTACWYDLSRIGVPPSARSGHRLSTVGKRVVVLGGEGGTGYHHDTVCSCFIDTQLLRFRDPVMPQSTRSVSGPAGATPPAAKGPRALPVQSSSQGPSGLLQSPMRTMPLRTSRMQQSEGGVQQGVRAASSPAMGFSSGDPAATVNDYGEDVEREESDLDVPHGYDGSEQEEKQKEQMEQEEDQKDEQDEENQEDEVQEEEKEDRDRDRDGHQLGHMLGMNEGLGAGLDTVAHEQAGQDNDTDRELKGANDRQPDHLKPALTESTLDFDEGERTQGASLIRKVSRGRTHELMQTTQPQLRDFDKAALQKGSGIVTNGVNGSLDTPGEAEVLRKQNRWLLGELSLARQHGYVPQQTGEEAQDVVDPRLLSLRRQVDAMRSETEAKMQMLKSELDLARTERTSAINDALLQRAKMDAIVSSDPDALKTAVSDELATLTTKLAESHRQVQELERELANKSIHGANIATSQRDLSSSASSLGADDMSRQLNELRVQLDEAQLKGHTELTKRAEAESSLAQAERRASSAEAKATELEKSNSHYAKVIGVFGVAMGAAVAKADTLHGLLDRAFAERGSLQQRIATLSSELESKQSEHSMLQEALQSLRGSESSATAALAAAAKMAHAGPDLNSDGSRQATADGSHPAEARIYELERQLAEIKSNHESVLADHAQTRSLVNDVAASSSTDGKAWRTRARESEREVERLRGQLAALHHEQAHTMSLPVNTATADAVSRDTDARVAELEQKMEEATSTYRDRLQQLEADYGAARKYVMTSEKSLHYMKEEVNRLKQANLRLQRLHDASGTEADREALRTAQKMLGELRSRNAQLEDQVAEAEKRIAFLLDEMDRSMDSYRQSMYAEHQGELHAGRGEADSSPDNERGSVALEYFAHELEQLRIRMTLTPDAPTKASELRDDKLADHVDNA